MIKKLMFYTLIGVVGVQPCMQAADMPMSAQAAAVMAMNAQAAADIAGPYREAVGSVVQTVISEGKEVFVPLGSAMFNLGNACIKGVLAGGRILWVTTKLGAKCLYVLSEGCMHLIRFSANHPQFVTGVAVGVVATYSYDQYNKRQAKQYRQKAANEIRDVAKLIRGQALSVN